MELGTLWGCRMTLDWSEAGRQLAIVAMAAWIVAALTYVWVPYVWPAIRYMNRDGLAHVRAWIITETLALAVVVTWAGSIYLDNALTGGCFYPRTDGQRGMDVYFWGALTLAVSVQAVAFYVERRRADS